MNALRWLVSKVPAVIVADRWSRIAWCMLIVLTFSALMFVVVPLMRRMG